MGWGTEVESAFSLVIFLYVPTEVRLRRLKQRELKTFGKVNPAFLQWAAEYDAGTAEGRSLARHEDWLATRECQVMRFHGSQKVAELLSEVERQVPALTSNHGPF